MHLAVSATLPLSSTAVNFIEEKCRLSPNKRSHSIRNRRPGFGGDNVYALPFKLETENPRRITVKDEADRIGSLPTPSKEGTEIFIMSQKDCEIRNISEFNDLFTDFVSAEELDLALKLLSNISSYGFVPNSRTFSIALRCYCKKGDLDNATRVFDQMLGSGCGTGTSGRPASTWNPFQQCFVRPDNRRA